MIHTSSLIRRSGRGHPARPHPPGRVPLRRGIRRLRAVDHPGPRGGRRPAGRPDSPPRAGWLAWSSSRTTWPAPRRRSAAAGRPRRSSGEVPAPIAGGAPSLADRVAAEADRFRRSGSPLAGFLADQLERLAQVIAFTGAQSPQDFVDRLDVHERDLLASEYDRGFADGRSRTAGYCPR